MVRVTAAAFPAGIVTMHISSNGALHKLVKPKDRQHNDTIEGDTISSQPIDFMSAKRKRWARKCGPGADQTKARNATKHTIELAKSGDGAGGAHTKVHRYRRAGFGLAILDGMFVTDSAYVFKGIARLHRRPEPKQQSMEPLHASLAATEHKASKMGKRWKCDTRSCTAAGTLKAIKAWLKTMCQRLEAEWPSLVKPPAHLSRQCIHSSRTVPCAPAPRCWLCTKCGAYGVDVFKELIASNARPCAWLVGRCTVSQHGLTARTSLELGHSPGVERRAWSCNSVDC